MPERFDVIVVGAGPAGCTAALALARAGLKVALFERGEYPGAKNMFGGVLYYTDVLNRLLPDFWKEAPVERYITRRIITFLTPRSSLSVDFRSMNFSQPPYNGFTLLRAKFDQWYARKAEEAGALLIPQTVVDDLVWDNNRVIGIRARRDQGIINADVVIAADGVNSIIAKKAGLRAEFSPRHLAISAKEVLGLSGYDIKERFGLAGNEGVANEFLGPVKQGIEGGGFLYTNKDSLSVGVVAKLSSLREKRTSITELLERLKDHPYLKGLLKGASLKEYSAHLVSEGGLRMIPELYGNGIIVVGDAAGLVCNTGLTLEGMNFAVASGFAAAEAVTRASEKKDFSKRSLANYKKLLEESFVLQDIRTFRRMPDLLANTRVYETYPLVACGVAERLFRVDGKPRRKVLRLAREETRGRVSLCQLVKDGVQIGRGLLWP